MTIYCQNCGKDTTAKPVSFYGNVVCGEPCRKDLFERSIARDTPPDAGSTWFCPHCGGKNPLADPKKDLRPNCVSCGKALDPASAAPPKKGGCLAVLALVALPMLGALLLGS